MIDFNKKPNNVKVVMLLFIVFSGLIIAGGFWWYGNQKHHTKKTWEETLESIARLKVDQIAEWRKERMNDALIVERSGRPWQVEQPATSDPR
jgi:hypothetical protein